jgi:hypothetical protein
MAKVAQSGRKMLGPARQQQYGCYYVFLQDAGERHIFFTGDLR